MIDIEEIRKKPDQFKRAVRLKAVPLSIDELLGVAQRRTALLKEVENKRHERNRLSAAIAANLEKKDEMIARARDAGGDLVRMETELARLDDDYIRLMALVPGLPADDVPEGESDRDNVEVRKFGEPGEVTFKLRDHLEIVELHGMANFKGARNAAGSRAYGLTGDGALLELAVLRFALDHVLGKGFTPVLPPLMVREHAMFGTGYFPMGEENAYMLERDKLYLTGTSEVGVVAMHQDEVFEDDQLPLRLVGLSACFRREAGAAGRDVKGLYRVHQFQKVEQVILCRNDADESLERHNELLRNAEEIVQALELPYRIVAVCTGDLGLGQVRKHDIETWMPSRQAYGETHSCSTFHDFQARRLNIRHRRQDGGKAFVHTLNNTAIASPRILIALLENHQNEDGTIYIPAALRPYLGGREKLGA